MEGVHQAEPDRRSGPKYSYCPSSYGLYSYVLYSYGLSSCGPYSYGLYSHRRIDAQAALLR